MFIGFENMIVNVTRCAPTGLGGLMVDAPVRPAELREGTVSSRGLKRYYAER